MIEKLPKSYASVCESQNTTLRSGINFPDLKMGFRERSKNYRNRTPPFVSHKIPPYEAELIFLDLKMGFREQSKITEIVPQLHEIGS